MKKIKAFTLIELIVVMAIMAILMSALMNFYKPIRQTYVDSTMIENIRTTHDGILNYLTENLKYAEELGIYDEGAKYSDSITVNSAQDAYKAFCDAYNIDDTAGSADYNANPNVHIICINRKQKYDINGVRDTEGYTGRLIVNRLDRTYIVNPTTNLKEYSNITAKNFNDDGSRTVSSTSAGDTYMALGGAFYGKSDFAIYIDRDKTWDSSGSYTGAITFTVQNSLTDESGVVKDGSDFGDSTVTVSGGVVTVSSYESAKTMNLTSVSYYTRGTSNNVLPDNMSAYPAGSMTSTNTINAGTKNTYIVYLEPDETR